ncbi:hypothetical protein BDY24DRAFT_441210 [Mrakia frigida]|uniref:zinc finger MYND domain-containing protein n=1 Tax=Mrakia frigida TaxID=29902 RepID=UPI003FCC219A
MSLTPTQFAQLLDLSPGIDGRPGRILSRETLILHFEQFNNLPQIWGDARTKFFSEVAAGYLPSFLRTFIYGEFDFFEEESLLVFSCYANWGKALIVERRASMGRFIRGNLMESMTLFLALVEKISNLPPESFQFDLSSVLCERLVACVYGFDNNLGTLSTTRAVPMPSPSVRERLREVCVFFEEDCHTRSAATKRNYNSILATLRLLAAGVLLPPEVLSPRAFRTWSSCQFTETPYVLITAPSLIEPSVLESCSELLDGRDVADMRVCGRCYGVRYCSREHQRLDWKKHKLECFPPSW